MTKALDAVGLLGEIVTFGTSVLSRPTVELEERREHCAFLQARLDDEIKTAAGGYSRFVDNFAPLLLTALDREIAHRKFHNDDAASKWDSLIGHLIPQVRADGGAVLEWLRDVSNENRAGAA